VSVAPQAARAALAAFGLAEAPLDLISHRENRVFAVGLPDGARAALRLHRPGYHDRAALEAELALMAHLDRSGLPVPRPIAATDGRYLVAVGEPPVMADLLSWVEGAPLGRSGTPLRQPGAERARLFHELGGVLGRLHNATDGWRPAAGFPRPAWDAEGLLGDAPVWGRFWDNPDLAAGQRALLLKARKEARAILEAHRFDAGIIHADAVRENVLCGPAGPVLIDFDDCGTGYRLFEIATALYPNRAEPDYSTLQAALLAGYRAVRPEAGALEMFLPLFCFLRSATYVGWIMARRDVPGAGVRSARFISAACAAARAFLA